MAKSIEEEIEDLAKRQLDRMEVEYFSKTDFINKEIGEALKKAPSKNGGKGMNYPDIKTFIQTKNMRKIPVMIEVKGRKGDLIKANSDGEIENKTKEGKTNYKNIEKYAVNGAIHYAGAIVEYTESYKEVIAIGINGYKEANEIKTELGVYYVSADNFLIPKKIEDYSDLSFLASCNIDSLIKKIDDLNLTDEEIEKKAKEFENDIEIKLKSLNQKMQDDLKISVGSRVELVTGMIMAGLGVKNKIAPLEISELKGEMGERTNDGYVIIHKIESFLSEKNLPIEKKDMIINDLSRVFIYSELWKTVRGESKLKSVYTNVKNNIMPIFTSAQHLDFTGKLFNVLNAWVDIPDSDKNDVVLTPRYVTELMARLAGVDKDSYVWDYAVGSAGFLISSMKLMIKDAEEKIKSPKKLKEKINKIKCQQLLGIEKRSDIYLLAVLNMILMGDGSSNIVHKDSLKEYKGTYEQGDLKGKKFPANVFLLNPPYSADGKGFVFVEKALSKMTGGKAVILIQENAGSGSGLPYTKNLLKNNTLLASIHMADIFRGKAGVQTAIYVFEIGKSHKEKQIVKFIDFSKDGYTRQNRRKSGQDVNLKNTDNAIERYDEIVDLVLYGKQYLHYFTEEEYIEDTITLEGNDWTFSDHKKINTEPTGENFKNTIKDFLVWKLSEVVKEENNCFGNNASTALIELQKQFDEKEGRFEEYKIGDLFEAQNGNFDIQQKHINNQGCYVVSSGEQSMGIIGKSDVNAKVFQKNTITIDMFGNSYFRDFNYKMVTHARVFSLNYKFKQLTRQEGLYFVSQFSYLKKLFSYSNMASFAKIKDMTIKLPTTKENNIDFDFIQSYINELEMERINELTTYLQNGF